MKYILMLKQVFSEWSKDKASKHAAALAYYTTFSLAPLLVIIISLAGLFGGTEAAQGMVMNQVQGLVGEEGRGFVEDMVASASARPAKGAIATAIGIITLVFGALGVFSELQTSLNTMWEVKLKPVVGVGGTLRRLVLGRLISFAMILVIGFLLLVSLIVSAGLSWLTGFLGELLPFHAAVAVIINLIVSLGVITLLFATMFRYLPDAKIAWRDVWLGGFVTAVLFTIGKFLIGMYLGRSNVGSTFGAAGSLAVLLIWIYYSAQIFFLGAEFTQVYANTYGSRIVPDEDAVKVTEEDRSQEGIAHDEHVQRKAQEQADEAVQPVSAGVVGAGYRPEASAAARSHHLPPPPQRRRTERARTIVSVALLGGVMALVASFAQIVRDVRVPRE